MSCQEDEIKFYTGPVAINMTVDGDGTFVSNETNEEKTFKMRVRRARRGLRIGIVC